MPIATIERETADAQDSIMLFFHENKDKHDTPSVKVFSVSNCYILYEDTTIDLNEIKACVSSYRIDVDLFAQEIIELEVKPKSEDPEEAAENEVAIKAKQEKLAKVKKDISVLEAFYKDINNQWGDIAC
ncbi:hypothetical protein EW146_g4215 [Bondarzewia mesenterica]|uniref:Uncharacterized protein n=1 Tax=Bondarzewia mesenterica TaxID=1095465 RepID=A0A4S4LXF0_9AGAM|nr:hypothetical protein EW146_g4215 [Bondarzewia mesenterica]